MATYLSGLNAPPSMTSTTARPSCHAFSGAGRRTLHMTCQAQASSSTTTRNRRWACLRFGLCLGLAAVHLHPRDAAAADEEKEEEPANNGWWLTEFPLPVRKILNKEINNSETGTRSFVKNGIFMADIGPSLAAHAYRLRSTALDLLALEDLLGKDASNYVNKYLRLKSTFMYYDFDKLITAAAAGDQDQIQMQKQPFIDLANRLFDSFETLQQALTAKDDDTIGARYAQTKIILQELMDTMAAAA